MTLRVLAIAGALAVAGSDGGPARSVLLEDRYHFCHDPTYPLTPEEHAYCPLVGDTSEACPTLPKACQVPPVTSSGKRGFRFGGSGGTRTRKTRGRGRGDGDGDGDTHERKDGKPGAGDGKDKGGDDKGEPGGDGKREKSRPSDEEPRPRSERSTASVPGAMSGLSTVLLFVLIAAFVVVVARAIAKNFVTDRSDGGAPDDAPKPADPVADAAPRGPIETDVERLLARARAAAARGDFARALEDAYAALLRRLDGDGLIDIHPSRTNGDYVRQLRERPDLKGPVRSVFTDVESVQFGAAAPSEQLFRSVLDRVVPLVSRALGVVLLCFGLGSALSCAPQGRGIAADKVFRGDTAPSGTQAIVELLDRSGVKARRRDEPLADLDRPLTLILLPDAEIDDEAWKQLYAWVSDKGGRLILTNGAKVPEPIGVHTLADPQKETALRVMSRGGSSLDDLEPRAPVDRRLVGEGAAPDLTGDALLERGTTVYAIDRKVGAGRVIVFADGGLFNNIALAAGDNAAFLAALVRSMPAPLEVELCDAWSGAGAANPFDSIRRAELTPVIAQLFVLLLLILLWKGVPFARLRDPAEVSRRAFADHARALGLAYGRARASRHVLGLYAIWALERLRERVHRAGRQGLIPLAEAISARTGRPESEIMGILVEASSARDEVGPPSFRPSTRGGYAAPARRSGSDVDADLALMREIEGFLAATGQRRDDRGR